MNISLSPSLSYFILNLLRPYKKYLAIMLVVGLVWALFTTFTPFMLKLIIDHVVNFKGEKGALLNSIIPYILGYIALWVSLCIDMRLLDWVKLKLYPSLRNDIICNMFNYLNLHSHNYFQNNFPVA